MYVQHNSLGCFISLIHWPFVHTWTVNYCTFYSESFLMRFYPSICTYFMYSFCRISARVTSYVYGNIWIQFFCLFRFMTFFGVERSKATKDRNPWGKQPYKNQPKSRRKEIYLKKWDTLFLRYPFYFIVHFSQLLIVSKYLYNIKWHL